MACENLIVVGFSKYLQETTGNGSVTRKCGDYYIGDMQLCPECEQKLLKRYPMGWRYVPGDVCRHGMYVGGCMEDWICGPCEMGWP